VGADSEATDDDIAGAAAVQRVDDPLGLEPVLSFHGDARRGRSAGQLGSPRWSGEGALSG